MTFKQFIFLLLFTAIALTVSPAAADEHADLLRKQKALEGRIAALEKEQAFLNFQKEFYLSDSKYLLLRPAEGVGELRYRHRLLKKFTFSKIPRSSLRTRSADAVSLTAKKEGRRGRHVLAFDDVLVILSKRSSLPPEKGSTALHIGLSREDLLSVYAALEVGAQAYVLK